MSVLSIGLARLATSSAACAITSSPSFLPLRNSPAFSTRNGRDATAPSAILAPPTSTPPTLLPSVEDSPRLPDENRTRRNGSQRNPRLRDDITVHLHRGGDAEDREVERA